MGYLKAKCFTKAFFKKMSNERIAKWIKENSRMLAGSCVATKSGINLSKIICKLSEKRSMLNGFIPSHIGSIVSKNGFLYVLNMKPPKADKIGLLEYIATTDENFVIVLRDFDLDTEQFSKDILKYDGKKYAYLSALQCISKYFEWLPNIGEHCSELHAHYLQKQGYFKGVHCDNLTPVEVYEMLLIGDLRKG